MKNYKGSPILKKIHYGCDPCKRCGNRRDSQLKKSRNSYSSFKAELKVLGWISRKAIEPQINDNNGNICPRCRINSGTNLRTDRYLLGDPIVKRDISLVAFCKNSPACITRIMSCILGKGINGSEKLKKFIDNYINEDLVRQYSMDEPFCHSCARVVMERRYREKVKKEELANNNKASQLAQRKLETSNAKQKLKERDN